MDTMKRPEDRETPGRKRVYERPTTISLFIPEAHLERVAALDIPGAKSRNAKLLALIEQALSEREHGGAVA